MCLWSFGSRIYICQYLYIYNKFDSHVLQGELQKLSVIKLFTVGISPGTPVY